MHSDKYALTNVNAIAGSHLMKLLQLFSAGILLN